MQRKFIICLLAVLIPLIFLLPLGVAAQGTGPSAGGDPPDLIDPTASALEIADAIARDPSIITGASFEAQPPITNTANAVSDTPLTLFPIYGTSYGILTSGTAIQADQPGTFSSTDLGGSPVRGDTDFDVTILKIDLDVPDGANCLSIDFQFLSEEFPIYVGTAYNDAFIAELDNSTWTTSGSVISAPNNFAFDPNGNVVSVNSTGVTQMSPSNGIGTAYDSGLPGGGDTNGAATVLLRASTPISAGLHSLYLSVFDQGDNVLDSAVFLDNLLVGVVDPSLCVPGADVENEIEMHKTVGTDPDVCALTDDITVAAGTVVYYCYTVENSGNVTLNLHDLTDSELGSLFTGLDYLLAPGDSVNTVAAGVTASATINATTVNTATWTAYNVGPVDVVSWTDAATVTLEAPSAVTVSGVIAGTGLPAPAIPLAALAAATGLGLAAVYALRRKVGK